MSFIIRLLLTLVNGIGLEIYIGWRIRLGDIKHLIAHVLLLDRNWRFIRTLNSIDCRTQFISCKILLRLGRRLRWVLINNFLFINLLWWAKVLFSVSEPVLIISFLIVAFVRTLETSGSLFFSTGVLFCYHFAMDWTIFLHIGRS